MDKIIEILGDKYEEKVGHKAEFYVVDVGSGAEDIEIKSRNKTIALACQP